MNHSKKWMVSLTEDQYRWIKETADETRVPGSAVIQELIGKTMRTKDGKFKESLKQAQVRIRQRALEMKKAEIEAELKKLTQTGTQSGDVVE